MTTKSRDQESTDDDALEVDLRIPEFAAFLAWIWPGAGHIYQRRYAKGILFMVCILGTFFFGLFLGEGKVVYAAWNDNEVRWQYIFQLGVGAPALPAIIQSRRVQNGQRPLFDAMRPPNGNERKQWQFRLNSAFDLGELFTMIAGLLNVLAIYDAYAGPFVPEPDSNKRKPPPDGDPDQDDSTDPKPPNEKAGS